MSHNTKHSLYDTSDPCPSAKSVRSAFFVNSQTTGLKITESGKMFSPGEITRFMVVIISFLFKDNIPVRGCVAPALNQVVKVINEIKHEKGEDEQFQLLSNMNHFMIYKYCIHFKFPSPQKDKREYCHSSWL